jgi:hypothetical protein
VTSEFKIDRPGVYRMRNGRRIYVWPLLFTSSWWSGEDGDSSACAASELYRNDGRLLPHRDSQYDIVEYIGRLPDDMLQRMAEALEAAEYQPHQTTPATFGEALKAMAENGADETAQPIECQLCGTTVNGPRVEWQYCNACTKEQPQ